MTTSQLLRKTNLSNCILGVLLVFISSASYAFNTQWLLDEQSGKTATDTDSKFSLMLQNMSKDNWVAGKSGAALYFNGVNQDASMQTGAEALQTPSVSLSAWVKADKTERKWEWIAAQGDNYGLYLIPDKKQIVFYIKYANNKWVSATSKPNSYSNNKWMHLTGSFDAAEKILRLYLNSTEIARKKINEPISYTSGKGFTIGSKQGDRFFIGTIDDVQVTDKPTIDISKEKIAIKNKPVRDTFAPVITLNGKQSTYVLLDTEYIDEGAKVSDNVDKNVSLKKDFKLEVNAQNIDTHKEGKYTLRYTATDAAGNTSTKERIIHIVSDRPPQLDPIENQTLFIGQSRNIKITAADADDDPLLISSSPLPSFITLQDNKDGTAILAINPQKPTDAETINITITASSNTLKASQTITIKVLEVDTVWDGSKTIPDVKLYPKPDYLKTFIDPIFGYPFRRVSDAKRFSEGPLGSDSSSARLRHHYASSAVWNADSSKYLLNFGQIRDSKTDKFIMLVNDYTKLEEFIWSRNDPNVLYGTNNNSLIKFNIKTKKPTTLRTFDGFGKLKMDNLKILSDNDQFIVVTESKGGEKKIAVYDLQNDRITAQINNIYAHPKITPGEHRIVAGISPSGNYVIVIDNVGSTHVFDKNLKYLRKLDDGTSHIDTGYDMDGNEVLVGACPVTMIQLNNGKRTDLLGDTYGCGHVSMRNYKQPGWAYVSVVRDSNPRHRPYGSPVTTEVVAIKLDKSGTNVRRIVHPRSTFPQPSIHEMHWPMAVPNPDGTKLIFNSSWDDPHGEINAYIVDLVPK